MTVQELHIDFNQKFDKVHSNRLNDYEHYEIDWWLHEAQLTFLRRRLTPKVDRKAEGNQYTQKRYDDLQSLIVPDVQLPVTVINDNKVYSNLPSDYFMLINNRSNVVRNCAVNDIESLRTQRTKYVACMDFIKDTRNDRNGNYYEGLNINIIDSAGTKLVFNISDTLHSAGFSSTEDFFMLLPHIISSVKTKYDGIEIYYNNYDNKRSNLIFVLNDKGVVPQHIQWGWQIGTSVKTTNFDAVIYDTYNNSTNGNEHENRIVKTEDLYKLLRHSFAKPIYHSPISNLADDRLYSHSVDDFIITSNVIDYYRYPKRIDYFNEITSEIHFSRHSEIVDIAVQLVAATTTSDNYNTIATENLSNE